MKILYYSPHPGLNLQSLSGYGTHMREMIEAFENQGCEVLPVIMGGIERPESGQELNSGNKLKSALKKGVGNKLWRTLKDIQLIRFDIDARKELDEAVRKFEPGFIYERANYTQLSGVKIAKLRSVPHVLEVNGPYVEETDTLSGTKSLLQNRILARDKEQLIKTDVVVTVSEALRDYFVELYNIPESKFLVLPNAFNRDSIKIDKTNQDHIKTKYGLNGKAVIGFVGSIFKWHNLENLIYSFSELENHDTKLLIVGFGEYVEKLKKIAANSHRERDIIFTGKISKTEIFDFIEVMDICVAPGAAWYQSPIKIFEYGAMAKPILAPDTAPVREIIDNGTDASLTNGEVKILTKHLETLIMNPKHSREMGESFQKKVLNEFTWDINAKRVIEKIESL